MPEGFQIRDWSRVGVMADGGVMAFYSGLVSAGSATDGMLGRGEKGTIMRYLYYDVKA